MRVILLLKSGRLYVLSEYPTVRMYNMVTGSLVTGGQVQVPYDHVEVIETYTDSQMDSFRARLGALEAEMERAT